jgi:hypothetical protein
MSILTLLLVTAPLTHLNASDVLTCPERIRTQQQIVSTHEGWEPIKRHVGPGNFGQIIGFADGKQPSSMKPIKTTKNGGTLTSTWKFSEPQRDIYVICAYDGTDIKLVRPLPASFRSCTIKNSNSDGSTKAWCSKSV